MPICYECNEREGTHNCATGYEDCLNKLCDECFERDKCCSECYNTENMDGEE